VAVLGGSHGAYAIAAHLALAGHRVRLWRRREADLAPIRRAGGIALVADGRRQAAALDGVTVELDEAVAGAEVVIVPLPAPAQAEIAGRLGAALDEQQIVLLTPGLLGSYVMARDMARAGRRLPFAFAETGTLPCLARRTGPAEVAVRAHAGNLPAGVFPAARTGETLDRVRALFPAVRPGRDALDVALTNPGPAIHSPLVLLNAGAIEAGRFDAQAAGMAPGARRLIHALDGERVAIRVGLEYSPPHYELPRHDGPAAAGEWFYGAGVQATLVDGVSSEDPVTFEHRYVVEDMALGLSLFESAGRLAGVETPVASGVLAVFQALLGRDLRAAGRGLDRLGLGDLVRREIRELLREGWASPLWRRAVAD
jgi:opine dehydrogenase